MQLAASMKLETRSKRACSLKAMPPTSLKPVVFCPVRVFFVFLSKPCNTLLKMCIKGSALPWAKEVLPLRGVLEVSN